MEKYGPLYHRNGARLLPSWVARTVVGVVIALGVCEAVFAILSVTQ